MVSKKLNAKQPKANNQKPRAKVKPKAKSQKKARAKPKAKSQKAKSQKAKWALEAKSQVGAQMRDPSSKMHAKHRF